MIKLKFFGKFFDYNGSNLNSAEIAGSEKTLINISTELAKDKNLIIKVLTIQIIKKNLSFIE